MDLGSPADDHRMVSMKKVGKRSKKVCIKNVVGQRVRQARMERKMTQVTLAEQLQLHGMDVGRAEVAKIEMQLRLVRDSELIALADALGVSDSWLLRGE